MDLGIDLEEPRFTQAEVLRMLPDLKAKSLQNWNQRGILDLPGQESPGRGGSRRYTPIGVLALDFMNQMMAFGVPPKDASEMADYVAEAAVQYVAQDREIIVREDGSRWIPIRPEMMGSFRQAIIRAGSSRFWLEIVDNISDPTERMLRPPVILIELDFIITQSLNRVLLLLDGKI